MALKFVDWVHALPFRVTTKIAVALTAAALFALGVAVASLAIHDRRELLRIAELDLRAQGDALAPMLREVWSAEGEGRARELLRAADAANADVSLRLERVDAGARLEGRGAHAPLVRLAVWSDPSETPSWALVLEKPAPPLRATLSDAARVYALAGVPLTLFGLLTVYVLGERLVGAPLRRIAERARQIGNGELEQAMHERGSDEIRQLKAAMNAMSADLLDMRCLAREEQERRIQAVERLRHADRLTTVGTLAAGIAHELGTPLNVVLLESRLVEAGAAQPDRVRHGAQLIRSEASRMTAIVRQLLSFARRSEPTRTREDACQIATCSAVLVSSLARSRRCVVDVCTEAADLPIHVDAAALQQVLTNILVNAFDAMPDGGRVRIGVEIALRAAPRDAAASRWVVFTVEDEGEGMDAATRARIFEPFFTTKDVGDGTGLGLSVALGIVEDHGGFIEVGPSPSGGSVFSVYLPAEAVGERDEAVARSPDPTCGQSASVATIA